MMIQIEQSVIYSSLDGWSILSGRNMPVVVAFESKEHNINSS